MAGRKVNSSALTKEIDPAGIKNIQKQVDKNSDIINDIVNATVKQYCKPLDDYVIKIQGILNDKTPPTAIELDYFVMNLPIFLYYAGEGQEAVGVKEDISKAVKMEAYNFVHINQVGTVSDKQAAAELATQEEYLVHLAYQRAYKIIKQRVEAGNELLQSIKKVMSRRIAEMELARVDPANTGGFGNGR